MDFRIKLLFLIGGGFVLAHGYEEYTMTRISKAEPEVVELAQLEGGSTISNQHIKIGKHHRIYPGLTYSYSQKEGDNSAPTASTKVNYAYYPVISEEHEFFKKLAELIAQHGDLDKLPDDATVPRIENFAVLVKTDKIDTVGQIPEDFVESTEIQGLVINKIDQVKADEQALIRQNFPSLDFNKVLVLEEGRHPSSLGYALGVMALGLVLMLVGLALFVTRA